MSTLFIPSRQPMLAGVFLLWTLLVATTSVATDQGDVCLTGTFRQSADPLVGDKVAKEPDTEVPMSVQLWLDERSWRKGYSLWQQSRNCLSAVESSTICTLVEAPFPDEDQCAGAQDGYEFLVMHRYLLETFKARWPDMEKQLAARKKFPQPEDYPAAMQPKVYAWSDNVLRAAAAVQAITKAKSAEILRRWPTEGEFGRWLQCGGEEMGLGVDALYGALLTNGIQGLPQDAEAHPHLMDQWLFWYAHSWIDQAWEKYRRAIGKMPDEPELQAALIRQCRVHQFWINQQVPPSKADQAHLYNNGEFNPGYKGIARVMAEVKEIISDKHGRIFFRIDPHLLGVNSLWVSSNIPLNENAIIVGDRLVFLGAIVAKKHLDQASVPDVIQSPALLLVIAIQSIK